MVPDTQFSSYYGKPVINSLVWESPDIPAYLFLGGLSGAGSLLGAGAQLTGRPALERLTKSGAAASGDDPRYTVVPQRERLNGAPGGSGKQR